MVTLDLSRVDKKVQGPLELESYLFLLIPSLQTKAQLGRPKRLTQLDNQLCIRRETYRIFISVKMEMVCM